MDDKRRRGNPAADRRVVRTGAALTVAAALVASGCGRADAVATAESTTTSIATEVTAAPGIEAESGPPPVTTPATRSAGEPSFLDSPAAIPNGPGTANTLGSEALAPLPDPDPSQRASAGPEVAGAEDGYYTRSQAETLVGHAITPVVEAYTTPSLNASVISTHDHPTQRGVPLVFQVLEGPIDGWVEVMLPVRPNGTTGWVPVEQLELTRNRYRLDLNVDRHELTVFLDGDELISTKVALGNGATPTPIGEFYLTELLRPPNPSGAYGPFAYGLSGFSETLESFNGGPGIIGIHGTNQPDLLGTDVSHGCIRVDNDIISDMATFLPLGTPITIHYDQKTLDPSQPF